MSDIMQEAAQALAIKNASAYEMLITTGLMKFLDRPVTLDEAADMARQGRITCARPIGRLYDETYSLDGEPFLFIGTMQTRTTQEGMSYKLHVDLPHRFIPRQTPAGKRSPRPWRVTLGRGFLLSGAFG